METSINTISSLFFAALIATPIVLFFGVKRWNPFKFDFLIYLIAGLIITAGLMGLFAWWSDYSTELLLSHYGYDIDVLDESGRYSQVAAENIDKVKQLEASFKGIGWPVKTLIIYAFYVLYLLGIYPLGLIVLRLQVEKKSHSSTTNFT